MRSLWARPGLAALALSAAGCGIGLVGTVAGVDAATGVIGVVGDDDPHRRGGPLRVATGSLPVGELGTAYSAGLVAAGGSPPARWTLVGGALPPGLALDGATGVIAGTPAATGAYALAVEVEDSQGQRAGRALSLPVVPPLAVATGALPRAVRGVAYEATLVPAGGLAPYRWTLAAGSFPAGLGPLAEDGRIAGTPSAAGAGSVQVRVTDARGKAASGTFTLEVKERLAIGTAALQDAVEGAPYSQVLAAVDALQPLRWSLAAGPTGVVDFPGGLTLNGASGAISGTPAAGSVGTYTFTVRAEDGAADRDERPFALAVRAPLAVSTSALPDAVNGRPYAATLTATGGVPPLAWTLATGTLPAGISLLPTGQITGTPSASAGDHALGLRVTDSYAGEALAPRTATRALGLALLDPVRILTASLPEAEVGLAYSRPLAASGGRPPLAFSLASGSLPSGLVLDGNGTLSGTPDRTGVFAFTATATDASAPPLAASAALQVETLPRVALATTSLPNGARGVAYLATLAATGGRAPHAWSLTGGTTLPAGLALDAAGGTISGTPTAAASVTVDLAVTDSLGAQAQRAGLGLAVKADLAVATTALTAGRRGEAYAATLAASGGTAPFAWSVAGGGLPPGLALGSGGSVTGTPTTTGDFSVTVRVEDSQSPVLSDSQALVLRVVDPLEVLTTALADAEVGVAHAQPTSARGGVTPLTWTVSAGALPAGLQLDVSSGQVYGTPTAALVAGFTLRATDAEGRVASQAVSLRVHEALAVATSALPGGEGGSPYSSTLAASGGLAPYTWALASGALPAGVTLGGGGTISGVPAAAGAFAPGFRVTDALPIAANAAAGSATRQLALQVRPPIATGRDADLVVGQRDVGGGEVLARGLLEPRGVSYDAAGQRLYVADTEHHRVVIYTGYDAASPPADPAPTAVIGQADLVSGLPDRGGTSPTASTLDSPSAVQVEPAADRLLVADTGNHRVLVYSGLAAQVNAFLASGTAIAATSVIGQPGFTQDSPSFGPSLATDLGTLNDPTGLHHDGARLLVADRGNHRVLIYEGLAAKLAAGPRVLADTVLGQATASGNQANRGLAAPGADTLAAPRGVHSDGTRLYVADSFNSRVLAWAAVPVPGAHGTAATLVVGEPDFATAPAAPQPSATQLGLPTGVLATGGRLVVTDRIFNRVLVYDGIAADVAAAPGVQNPTPEVVLGQSDLALAGINRDLPRPAATTLNDPFSASTDGTRLFVADRQNHRVLVYPTLPAAGAHGPAAQGLLGQAAFDLGDPGGHGTSQPTDVVVVGARLAVADHRNNRVLLYDPVPGGTDPRPTAVLGQANLVNAEPNGPAGLASDRTLSGPAGLATDGTRLYVADAGNHRVLIYDSAATLATGAAADRALGQQDLASGFPNGDATGAGGQPFDNTLRAPTAVATDGTRLYVADTDNHRVLVFGSSPAVSNASADAQIGQNPSGAARGFNLRLPNQGAASPGAATLSFPSGLLADGPRDRLLVADAGNHRVLVYEGIAAKVAAFAAAGTRIAADRVLGQVDFASNLANRGGAASAGSLNLAIPPPPLPQALLPVDLAFDGTRLAVSDPSNHRVLVWDAFPVANGQPADRVLGQGSLAASLANRGGPVGAGTLFAPLGLAMDATTLFVADTGASRVLGFR
ncbi:MAG: putative Ig domain-containing protein [Planctomycetes bacterium]|nr:putative Ig domain-containing protein [Planctomycetota bacterium]